jgi:ubiquitin C-terminal hydrolase
MFGITNIGGSCWVNATLQAIFRIPEVQQRYDKLDADASSAVDTSLQQIWTSHASRGIQEFFASVKSEDMPAGEGIGDSHELLVALCDKLPYLDKLLRFGFGTRIKCDSCPYENIVRESVLEFPLHPSDSATLSKSIEQSVQLFKDSSWKCDECKNTGCTQQHLLAALPKILVFHRKNVNSPIQYPSVLVLNGVRFAMFAVVCYNGGHWWTIGRDLPPGKCWHTFDDTTVRKHSPDHFPVANTMRLLFYAQT